MDAETPTSAVLPSRLDSWKEIATYLKRDVRTVQRWEKEEGLPVRRLQHVKQGSVYAHTAEINKWWESRGSQLERALPQSNSSRRIAIALVLAIVTLTSVGWRLWRGDIRDAGRSAHPSVGVFEFPVPVTDSAGVGLAMAPDGSRLAFDTCCPAPGIWVHTFASATTMPVKGAEGGLEPFWSPDGSRLAFFADLKLKTIDLAGGPAVTVCDAPVATQTFHSGSWNTQGTIVFAAGSDVFRVPADGGLPVRVPVHDDAGESAVRRSPRFLADGRHFIYHATGSDGGAIYVASLDSQQTTRLLQSDYPAEFVAPSHVLFLRGAALMAQAMDLQHVRLEGSAMLVAANVAPGNLFSPARFSASSDGELVFMKTRGGRSGKLTWFDRAGVAKESIPQPADVEYLNPAISPSGEQVAVNRMDPQTGNWDVWTVDLATEIPSRVTFDRAQDTDPVWSPDEKELVFASNRGGGLGLYRKTVGGTRPEELLLAIDGASSLVPTDWSRDGRFVIYTVFRGSTSFAIWALPMVGERKPFQVLQRDVMAYAGRISPDGKWIAYGSFETGTFEVYVQPFGISGKSTRISSGGGAHPRWRADGRELVYWAVPGGLASVDLEYGESGLRASAPKTLVATPVLTLVDTRTHWDMTRDGRHFLLRQAAGVEQPAFTVILNWLERLRQ